LKGFIAPTQMESFNSLPRYLMGFTEFRFKLKEKDYLIESFSLRANGTKNFAYLFNFKSV